MATTRSRCTRSKTSSATIKKAIDIVGKFWGRPPRGWFGPGLTQTFDTLDYLSQAGIEYIGDWVLDDEPVTLKTTHKPVVALPYNFELHDIVMMALQNHPSEEMYRRSMDAFDCLYEESKDRAKIMSIAVHPYLSGQTHRIKHVERTFEEILSKPGVACWSGEKILDWYLGTQKAKARSERLLRPARSEGAAQGRGERPARRAQRRGQGHVRHRRRAHRRRQSGLARPGQARDRRTAASSRSCSPPARPSPARRSATSSSTASPA